MKKSDLKIYQGKDRIYPSITGAPNIRKILVWNDEVKEYRPPSRGKLYCARRYEVDSLGKRRRVSEYFESIDAARAWQSYSDTMQGHAQPTMLLNKVSESGPTLREVIEEWREKKFAAMRSGTRIHYNQIVRNHFQMLMDYRINAITPKVIDEWLAERKRNLKQFTQSKKRTSFDGEVHVLKVIFNFYGEYHDEDLTYRFPFKKRHLQDSKLSVPRLPKKKDVTEEEFLRFRRELEQLKYGTILAPLSSVQYYEALRISEAAGLHWEDLRFNFDAPEESAIQIVRYVEYRLEKGTKAKISPGFKNSESSDGVKELPMFPETFRSLAKLYDGSTGPIFQMQDGNPFPYHVIRYWYNKAFQKAGLPYKATHVMRHGWTREILDHTNGDYAVAGQLLGNSDADSIRTYAKRSKGALTAVARSKWGSAG